MFSPKMTKTVSYKFSAELFCSLCAELPRIGPIFQCELGHLMCEACSNLMDICPTCQSTNCKTRSFIAEKFLAKIPKPCKFAANGCKEEFLDVS